MTNTNERATARAKEVFNFGSSRRPKILEKEKALARKLPRMLRTGKLSDLLNKAWSNKPFVFIKASNLTRGFLDHHRRTLLSKNRYFSDTHTKGFVDPLLERLKQVHGAR